MLSPGQAAQAIMAEYDEEGIFFYQAFNEQIADYALQTKSSEATISTRCE